MSVLVSFLLLELRTDETRLGGYWVAIFSWGGYAALRNDTITRS